MTRTIMKKDLLDDSFSTFLGVEKSSKTFVQNIRVYVLSLTYTIQHVLLCSCIRCKKRRRLAKKMPRKLVVLFNVG